MVSNRALDRDLELDWGYRADLEPEGYCITAFLLARSQSDACWRRYYEPRLRSPKRKEPHVVLSRRLEPTKLD